MNNTMSITLDDLHADPDENNMDQNDPNNQDDPNPQDDPNDPNDPNDPSQDPPADPADPTDPEVSGIEQYLTEHGIAAGMVTIDTEEGEVDKHFNDLSDDEQFNVLKSLAERGGSKVGAEYGLDEEETKLVNFVREQEGSIEDIVEGMAQQRVDEMIALQQSSSVDFTTMSSDAIYTKWLQETNPDATDDEIADELTSAKEGKFFETNVGRIKSDMIQSQVVASDKQAAEDEIEYQQDLDRDRQSIVHAVEGITNVNGFPITDEDKNFVLSKVLEVGESGDSLFMEEVFSNPEILFKTALTHYMGEDQLNSMETYYKKEITKASKRGAQDLIDGATPVQFNGSKPKAEPNQDPAPRVADRITLDELHSD